MKVTKEQVIKNTEILTYENNRYRLAVKESLLILSENPVINKQFDNFTSILKLHKNRNTTSNENQNSSVEVLTYEQGKTAPSAPQLSQVIPSYNNATPINININNIEESMENQINKYEARTTIPTSQQCRGIAPLNLVTQGTAPKNDNIAKSPPKHSQDCKKLENNILLNKTPERTRDQVIINNNNISPLIIDRIGMLINNTRQNERILRSNKINKND